MTLAFRFILRWIRLLTPTLRHGEGVGVGRKEDVSTEDIVSMITRVIKINE